jgi:hypothetical protein
MVSGSAGLHSNQTARQLGEKLQNLGAPQLPAANNRSICRDTVDLKHPLREIETNRRNLCHPESSIDLAQRPYHRTATLGRGPSTASGHRFAPACGLTRSNPAAPSAMLIATRAIVQEPMMSRRPVAEVDQADLCRARIFSWPEPDGRGKYPVLGEGLQSWRKVVISTAVNALTPRIVVSSFAVSFVVRRSRNSTSMP